MQVTTIGLDLAKNVFQVHGVTANGDAAFNRSLRRTHVLTFFESLPPCLVGIEACGTSHYWAREIAKFGHEKANEMIEGLVAGLENFHWIELNHLLIGANGKPAERYFADDRIHLNEHGYRRIGDEIRVRIP